MKKVITVIMSALGLSLTAQAGELLRPTTMDEFKKVTVKIEGSKAGGTGVIYRSTSTGSYLLTNKHICELGKESSLTVTTTTGQKYQAEKFKASERHDVCVIKVSVNLKYNTKIAKNRAGFGDAVTVTGHPYLYPTMVKTGHVSEDMTIKILTGWADCTKEEYKKLPVCAWFGGLPIVSTLESQTASFTIAGGNSGSAVFNSSGEIVGLVYAGSGKGMSPAILVPHEYVLNFVKNEVKNSKIKWNKITNKYIIGRTLSSKTRKAVRGVIITSTKQLFDLHDLVFPAIKSNTLNRFIDTYNCVQEGGKLCFAK